MHCSRRLIVQTLVFSPSYLHRQVSPPETLLVKGGTTWAKNGRWILPEYARLRRNIQGSFICHKSTTWDKRLYIPSVGRRVEDFFALKNPTASAGFEPVNLGTKGQHATSRPPKPHVMKLLLHFFAYLTYFQAGGHRNRDTGRKRKWFCIDRDANDSSKYSNHDNNFRELVWNVRKKLPNVLASYTRIVRFTWMWRPQISSLT